MKSGSSACGSHVRQLLTRSVARFPAAFAHEGPIFDASLDKVFFTSNRQVAADGTQYILIGELQLRTMQSSVFFAPELPMANGATLAAPGTGVFCGQGSLVQDGGLFKMDLVTRQVQPLVTAWQGKPFNSPNDVFIDGSGHVWFTDPDYGHAQGFRPAPVLGPWVWRGRIVTDSSEQAVANGTGAPPPADSFSSLRVTDVQPVIKEGLDKPNGIAMSPDGATLYVSDTGYFTGTGTVDPTGPNVIYAYDVVDHAPVVTSRRTFAAAAVGAPDGVKLCHRGTQLYYGAGDGLHVLDVASGQEVAVARVPGGVANFVLVNDSMALAMCQTQIVAVQL